MTDITYYCSSSSVIYWFPGILKERNSNCTLRLLSKINSYMNTHFESYSHIYFNIGLPSTQMVRLGAGREVVFNGLYYKGWSQAYGDAVLGVFIPRWKTPAPLRTFYSALPQSPSPHYQDQKRSAAFDLDCTSGRLQPELPGTYSKLQALSGAVLEGCPGVFSTAVSLCLCVFYVVEVLRHMYLYPFFPIYTVSIFPHY